MQSFRNLVSLLLSGSLFVRLATAAAVDNCNVLTCEQQSLIGLRACPATKVSVRAVPEVVTEYFNTKPYEDGQRDFITPGNLIGIQSSSTNSFGTYAASYFYYNYNQCYDFDPLTHAEVYVTNGQSDDAGYYCYYSNWGCYGEEVCIKNNGVTVIPVSDDIKLTGIRSTMLKQFHDRIDEEGEGGVPKDAIAWVY